MFVFPIISEEEHPELKTFWVFFFSSVHYIFEKFLMYGSHTLDAFERGPTLFRSME